MEKTVTLERSASAPPSASVSPTASDVRPEIQALRAVAVLLVVIYHLWPERLGGGFIGVDVFFVISGFLITSHLVRESDRSGTIVLRRFWARRIRRLLPASLLVLAVTAVTTILVVPDTFWVQFMGETAASAFYGENWLLAANAVDYLAAENVASPVQHFWSLSVEEQFYVVWPVLLVLVAMLVGVHRRRAQLVTLVVITTASFVTSVVWTSIMPASAYFATPTRIWEFGIGGILAFVTVVASWSPVRRAVLSAVGLTLIGISAVAYTGSLPFPGALALVPVLGTAAVIAAGDPRARWSPTRMAALRPIQFLGNTSYSIYLWHWPPIVIVPILTGLPLTWTQKVVILVGSVLLAWLTKRWVEDPFRVHPRITGASPLLTIAAAALAGILFVGASTGASLVVDSRIAAAAQAVEEAKASPCFGAGTLNPVNDCDESFRQIMITSPTFAKSDNNYIADPDGGWQCETPRGDPSLRPCERGDLTDPVHTIAMLGDSHAMHWVDAVGEIAERQHWKVVTYFKSACSGTGADDVILLVRPDDQEACAQFGRDAIAAINADPTIDAVFFANSRGSYHVEIGDEEVPISSDSYIQLWDQFLAAGKSVFVMADVPGTGGGDIPGCIASAEDAAACNTPVARALVTDAVAVAAREAGDKVTLLDLTNRFCDEDICYSLMGGVIVYSDPTHMTKTYARTLEPELEAALLNVVQ